MTATRVVAWTVFAGPPEALWADVARAEAGPFASVDDPAGLTDALRGARPGRFAARVGAGPLGEPVEVEVTGGLPGLRVALRVRTRRWGEIVVRRRLERTLGGGTRLVDEVIVPASRATSLVRLVVLRWLRAAHTRAAAGREVRRVTTTRAWTLVDANLAHADPVLAALDGPRTG